jgi:hypothetical protein
MEERAVRVQRWGRDRYAEDRGPMKEGSPRGEKGKPPASLSFHLGVVEW